MERDVKEIRKDRLRYTKNKLSANLAYVAILFNVLYFVSVYSSDVNNYYYNIGIGLSVLCNLLFLLTAFLSSEGVKNYKMNYSYIIMVLGLMQFLRIFGIPARAHKALTVLDGVETTVMGDKQFTYIVVCLIISGVACIASGIINAYKSYTLTKYQKEHGLV